MFQKRILEVFVFCLYWLCLVPVAYEALMQKYFLLSYERVGQFAVATLFGYMCVHALAICIYLKCKTAQLESYANLRKREAEERRQTEAAKGAAAAKPSRLKKLGPIGIV